MAVAHTLQDAQLSAGDLSLLSRLVDLQLSEHFGGHNTSQSVLLGPQSACTCQILTCRPCMWGRAKSKKGIAAVLCAR